MVIVYNPVAIQSTDGLASCSQKRPFVYYEEGYTWREKSFSRMYTAEAESAMEKMKQKLKTESGKALYKMRKAIVEPVFGQIKAARGIRAFHLRGMEKACAEWKLICATHNLLKLFRASRAARQPQTA